jgi:hypothetical protein
MEARVSPRSVEQSVLDVIAVGSGLRGSDIDKILNSEQFNSLHSKELLRPIYEAQKAHYDQRIKEVTKEFEKDCPFPLRVFQKGEPIIDPNIKEIIEKHYGRR